VIKVGSSVLAQASGTPRLDAFHALATQLAACARQSCEVVVVSSGAIACGMAVLGLTRRPKELAQLQACAAIGQGQLMRLYSEACARCGLTVAQVLLTEADLSNAGRCRNARRTLEALLARRVVPIVNENDTVAVDEITFGDNDRLAALVASLIRADLLMMLSDVDGLLRDGRVVERLDDLNQTHDALAKPTDRSTTKGGMLSKLSAARIARHAGIPMVIANGHRDKVVLDILAGQPIGTLIPPPAARLSSRKWWIAFSVRKPQGTLVVDDGAAEALHRHASLLASGIQAVAGRFHAGDSVAIVTARQEEIARGISSFSSGELLRIRGLKTHEIASILGVANAKEVVHRDQLVLMKEAA
jgi:glutamate 5-kinase